jgi:hypothetical protein
MERRLAERLDIYAEWKRFRTSGPGDKCDCESGRQVAKKNTARCKIQREFLGAVLALT